MFGARQLVNHPKSPFGINLAGYFQSEKGVGEMVRSALRVVRATGIPYAANNVVDSGSQNVERLPSSVVVDNPYAVNVITMNPAELVRFAKDRPTYFENRFNVGYWAWELSAFPSEYHPAFDLVDEVWTTSEFARDSIAANSHVPVRVVPCSLDANFSRIQYGRDSYGIPEHVFSFLFVFDFHSTFERKNPIGVIEAFKKAFGSRIDVELLIKSSHSRESGEQLQMLRRASDGANVRILDTVLSKEALRDLMMATDCYISLHRCEGFGLTIAEAMLCAKPTVATDYSGSCDFISSETGFPVPYKLVHIEGDHGPYRAGQQWAQPDLDYAADVMRYIEQNRVGAAETGRRAKAHVSYALHPVTIAKGVLHQLQELDSPDGVSARVK